MPFHQLLAASLDAAGFVPVEPDAFDVFRQPLRAGLCVICRVQLITLTTDFGARDWFAGTMKGVIAGLAPKANVVDLTHEIAAGDIRAGAFALRAGYHFFPKGAVHVAVIDPGVGSERRAIAVRTANYLFVGPDNGVLSWALAREKIKAVHALENEAYFLPNVSNTFHGRDLFAPVAAHLVCGLPLRKLGPALKDFARLDWPEPRRRKHAVEGEVVYLDRFGNAITNIANELVPASPRAACELAGRRRRLCPLKKFYQAVPLHAPVAIPGSSGFLEIAINGGSAARSLGLRLGNGVVVR
jgi:S-adenosylmethionine hydrolase